MLQFLRKYQKFFFGLVAVVTIASFSFFGSNSAIQGSQEIPDRRIGTTIDGSPLMQGQVELLVRFLSTSPEEHGWLEKGQIPNLFNDGVVQRDFLQTGALSLAVQPYLAEIASEVQERIDRARSYRHYMHPQAPFVSAEAVWNQFAPSMKQGVEKLQTAKTSEEALSVLGQLYLDQQKLPSDVLRRILTFQEKQYEWLTHDQKLDHADLDLFGFQTLEDWFGPKTMHLIAQVILNGSAEAHRQGYRVSEEEARRSLQQNIYAGAKKTIDEHELTGQDLQRLYRQQIHFLQRDEAKIVALWQKVLEFRHMMDAIGAAVAIDEAEYRQFSDFACEKLRVDIYELPEALRLKNFRELLKLQTYLDATAVPLSKKRGASLDLPQFLASPSDILGLAPELVEYRYTAEIAEITNDSLASRIALKEIYAWEMEEGHWGSLQNEFPALAQKIGATIEERYVALEQLESDTRRRIDQFAREAIVKQHPEWIESAFAEVERKKISFSLRRKGGQLPFLGVKSRDDLHAALRNAPIQTNHDNAVAVPLRLDTDEFHHYEIVLLQPPSELTLVSFAEASADGTLDALLDKKLEVAYPDVRKKNTTFFQVSHGAWKPLSEVKDHVGAYLYADLLQLIESDAKKTGINWPKPEGGSRDPQPLDLYAQYRMHAYVKESLSALSQGSADTKPLSEQWRLVKKEKEMSRSELQAIHLAALFDEPRPTWSSIIASSPSSWSFIHAKERTKSEKSDIDEMVATAQKSLGDDAKREVMKSLIAEITAKKAIVVSLPEPTL